MHTPISYKTFPTPEQAVEEFASTISKYQLYQDSRTVYSNKHYRAEFMITDEGYSILVERWKDIPEYKIEKLTFRYRLQRRMEEMGVTLSAIAKPINKI